MSRILIIEDDQILRKQMAQIIRFEGFEALEAADGKLGIASAVDSVPDLIICDIMMPELDGFGVLAALRDNPQTALTPFIFLTAKGAGDDRRRGMEEGADDYITKPYNPDELVRSVRRRLEKRNRQLEESRLRAEEVRLAVSAAVPLKFKETLDQMLSLDYATREVPVSAIDQTVAQESMRVRRMMRRLHLYVQLPQLYGNRFELAETKPLVATRAILERVARDVCRSAHRERDLAMTVGDARLPLREDYFVLLIEELVDNACKFSEPGSPVEVKLRDQPEFWSLTVSNRGAGMSADQIARIGAFKQFWSGNEKPAGLGLGLALTQGVARLHGCEFAIESGGDETVATVLIPLEPEEPKS
jgi:DNA-binding response OmpR family regulator